MLGIPRLNSLRQLKRCPELFKCRRVTRNWIRLTFAYLGLKKPPFQISMPTGDFAFSEVSDVATFWQIFCAEVYPVSQTDHTIIDAGANIGIFTLYALLRAGTSHVIAIEPAPDSCARIRSLLRSHNVESRCTLHHIALGAYEGETTIQLAPASQFRRTGIEGVRVLMKKLDSFVSGPIDFLKMDVEGAEACVIRSASPMALGQIRRIAMEYHPQEPLPGLLALLQARGFRISRVRDDGEGYGLLWLDRDIAGSNN